MDDTPHRDGHPGCFIRGTMNIPLVVLILGAWISLFWGWIALCFLRNTIKSILDA